MNRRPPVLNLAKALTGFIQYKAAEGLSHRTLEGYGNNTGSCGRSRLLTICRDDHCILGRHFIAAGSQADLSRDITSSRQNRWTDCQQLVVRQSIRRPGDRDSRHGLSRLVKNRRGDGINAFFKFLLIERKSSFLYETEFVGECLWRRTCLSRVLRHAPLQDFLHRFVWHERKNGPG